MLFPAAFCLNFVVNIFVEITYMNAIDEVHLCLVYSLLLVTKPTDGVAYLKFWRICHCFLFIEDTVPVPFKELWVNMIFLWGNEYGILYRFKILDIILLADVLFQTNRKQNVFVVRKAD